ncbi:MAG: hypothetical protein ACRD5E_00710 [Nitrososphaeraceae archaeon]
MMQGEETAEDEGLDEGESSEFTFNSGQPRPLRNFCEYHPTAMIRTIDLVR